MWNLNMHKIFIHGLFVFSTKGTWKVSKYGLRGKTLNPPGQVTTPSQTITVLLWGNKKRLESDALHA